MKYIPDLKDKGGQYIERQFLFTIVNTCDRDFFRDALCALEQRRAVKAKKEFDANYVEIDKSLLQLLERIQSRLTPAKRMHSKRVMGQLMMGAKRRKRTCSRKPVEPLELILEPKL